MLWRGREGEGDLRGREEGIPKGTEGERELDV